MDSVDTYLKQALVAASLLVVVLLGAFSIYRLLGDDTAPVAEPGPVVTEDPAGPAATYPGGRLEIGDLEFPLTIGCVRRLGSEDVYLLTITNRGRTAIDYLVVAELVDAEGSTVETTVDVAALRPDEEREVVLLPTEKLEDIDRCSIVAVESDRRVILGP